MTTTDAPNATALQVFEEMRLRLHLRSDEEERKEQRQAIEAVAEYVAAAERMRDNLRCVLSVNCKCDDEFIDKQTAEFDAAHARMKGEMK